MTVYLQVIKVRLSTAIWNIKDYIETIWIRLLLTAIIILAGNNKICFEIDLKSVFIGIWLYGLFNGYLSILNWCFHIQGHNGTVKYLGQKISYVLKQIICFCVPNDIANQWINSFLFIKKVK